MNNDLNNFQNNNTNDGNVQNNNMNGGSVPNNNMNGGNVPNNNMNGGQYNIPNNNMNGGQYNVPNNNMNGGQYNVPNNNMNGVPNNNKKNPLVIVVIILAIIIVIGLLIFLGKGKEENTSVDIPKTNTTSKVKNNTDKGFASSMQTVNYYDLTMEISTDFINQYPDSIVPYYMVDKKGKDGYLYTCSISFASYTIYKTAEESFYGKPTQKVMINGKEFIFSETTGELDYGKKLTYAIAHNGRVYKITYSTGSFLSGAGTYGIDDFKEYIETIKFSN